MAAWQFDIHFIPSAAQLPRVGVDDFDTEPCWKDFSTAIDISGWLTEKLGVGREVLPGWMQWGQEDGNRVDAQISNNYPSGLSARIDARSLSEPFLSRLCELAGDINCHFFCSESNAIINPNIFQLRGALSKSRAARFSKNPREFLEGLAKGEGSAI